MSKFINIGDPHIRLTAPRSRNDNIKEVFEDKFNQINELAKRENVDYILCNGDLFDRANCNVETLSFVEKLIKLLEFDVILSVGNHSLIGNTMNNFEKSMIYLLDRLCDNLIILRENNSLELDDCILHFNHYGNDNFIIDDLNESKPNIIVSHSMIVKEKEFFTCISAEDIETNADLILNGHNHSYFQVGKVLNIGALVRLTTSKGDMDREVRVAILSVADKNIDIKEVKLNISDYKEVFDVKQVMKKKDILSEAMLGKLNDSIKQISSVKDILSIVMKDEVYDKEDLSLLQDYLGDDIL